MVKGGCILIAVSSGFSAVRCDYLEVPDLEALLIKLLLPRGTILPGCVHFPPPTKESAYSHFNTALPRAATKTLKDTLIFGGFSPNID